MTNPNWPLTKTQIAFATAPNDPNATLSYTDVSERVRSLGYGYGRQYETDQNQSGEASLVMSDRDEYLNPGNPSSPFAPLKLYRRIIDQAMWPPAPVGGATNLLWGQGIDPSFESYAAGAVLSWIKTVGSGVSPAVTASNPQQGSRCLSYATTAGSGTNGVGLVVNCIPGEQYTASVYVQQTAANTLEVFINDGATGGTTTTTGAYVRLSVTWTASQLTHEVWVASFGTSLSGTVYVDAIQHEPGATATGFATSGPTIYGVFNGYVERWPSSWDYNGMYGLAEITCIDQMAILEKTDLHTELVNAILAKQPDYYWPLSEPQGAGLFADNSGNPGVPSLVRVDSTFGSPTTFEPGTQTNLAGDPQGTGVKISATGTSVTHGAELSTGQAGTPKVQLGGDGSAAWAITVGFWYAWDTSMTTSGVTIAVNSTGNFGVFSQSAYAISATMFQQFTEIQLESGYRGNYQDTGPTNAFVYDGAMHFIVLQVSFSPGSPGTFTQTVYVDGQQIGTSTVDPATAFGTGTPNFSCDQIQVGGWYSNISSSATSFAWGLYSDVAVWKRALTAAEIADIWTAGHTGYAGETSGARIARYLGYGYSGATAIDTGMSLMAAGTVADGTSLLGACQDVATSENGNFYADSGGTVTFKSRRDRYLKLTAKYTLGEQENPYEPGITFDFDPTRVFNDIEVTRNGGITARAIDTASIKENFRSSFDRTINVQSDLETIDCANYLLGQFKQPRQRVAGVALKPSANPALWPVALGAQIGDRVTVKRRTSAGVTITADFFIEKISHSRKPGEWVVSFELSPAGNSSVWVLDDPTYSVLDSTTILAY